MVMRVRQSSRQYHASSDAKENGKRSDPISIILFALTQPTHPLLPPIGDTGINVLSRCIAIALAGWMSWIGIRGNSCLALLMLLLRPLSLLGWHVICTCMILRMSVTCIVQHVTDDGHESE